MVLRKKSGDGMNCGLAACTSTSNAFA